MTRLSSIQYPCLVAAVLLLGCISQCQGRLYELHCPTHSLSVYTEDEFGRVSLTMAPDEDENRRSLESDSNVLYKKAPALLLEEGIHTTRKLEDYVSGKNVTTLLVRPCQCKSFDQATNTTTLWLCPAHADFCGFRDTNHPEPECYQSDIQHTIATNAWPLVLLWYFGLMIICCCTIHGYMTMGYLRNLIRPNHNREYAETLQSSTPLPPAQRWQWWQWQRYRFEHNMLAQAHWIWNQAEFFRARRENPLGLPRRVALKTKRYALPDDAVTNSTSEESQTDDLDSQEEPTCSICFVPLEDGDRVGDLSCPHVFHAECLKVWCKRKNSCPLCNTRIADVLELTQEDQNESASVTTGDSRQYDEPPSVRAWNWAAWRRSEERHHRHDHENGNV